MMNFLLLPAEIVVVFGMLLIFNKLLKKEGLFAWVAIASVLANILTAKQYEISGISVTCGCVMFASIFLATDIISEKYGEAEAKKAVVVGVLSTLAMVVASQITLLYAPASFDYADSSMKTIFGLSLRISISSVVMFALSNYIDVILYGKIKAATDGKYMWLRNNVSTILCNCGENFLFMYFAFIGVYDLKTVVTMALSVSVVEAVVGLLDTPFLYLATKK